MSKRKGSDQDHDETAAPFVAGDNNTVVGDVHRSVSGSGNTIVGPNEPGGTNTIYNQPMAVGYGGQAGPGSISIGAFAGAGIDPLVGALQQLAALAQKQNADPQISTDCATLIVALQSETKDPTVITHVWNGIQKISDFGGASALVQQIAQGIAAITD